MKTLSCLLVIGASFLAGCRTAFEWREVETGPAPRAEVYDAVDYLARGDGFLPGPDCDRGLGIWESKWKYRHLGLGRPGRYRLRAELMIDQGSSETGWLVRYKIDQQKVDDLRKATNPRERDWETDGQDTEREALFGERFRLRFGLWTAGTKAR